MALEVVGSSPIILPNKKTRALCGAGLVIGENPVLLEPTEFSPQSGENSKRPAIRKSRPFQKAKAGRGGYRVPNLRLLPAFDTFFLPLC